MLAKENGSNQFPGEEGAFVSSKLVYKYPFLILVNSKYSKWMDVC